jgi:hypothetical protein
MYGALGGVSVVAALLQKDGPKPGVLLLWSLFAVFLWCMEKGVPV